MPDIMEGGLPHAILTSAIVTNVGGILYVLTLQDPYTFAESELAKFPNAEMIVNGLLDANDTKFEELEKASRRNGVSEEFINAFIRDQMLGFFAKHKFAAIISELEFSVDEHGHRQAIFINPKSNEIPIDRRIYNMTEFPKKKKRK